MVTAGVYLIVADARALRARAASSQDLAAGLGAATILIAGLIALVQTDIKRVIAYSTMSQIGYMFLAVGIGAYANGMFHLMTHAFFKALLFLAAGIVIHALDGRAGHAEDGRLTQATADDVHRASSAGSLALVGDPAVLRLLLQGLDPRRRARPRAGTAPSSGSSASPARC